MKVMILAAGHGKRMLPLTASIPKPLLRAGNHRLIEWQIIKLASSGFRDVVINTHHLAEQIPAALGDGARYGVTIQYSAEHELLETAGGIINALPLLGAQAFAVVNGDVWTDYDYSRLHAVGAAMDKGHTLAHLVLVPNAEHHPQGDFYLANNGLVSDTGEPRLTFSGISVLHPRLFAGVSVQRLPLSPLLRQAMLQQQVTGEHFVGDWQDIGSPERLKALECRLLNT
ncbi:nucleotidyltransferase family protein [Gammaproteobacteria bacterium LSUCC0112]|nr:nucleotidyltransferase family protein [Gammaproteobacteria bacterium LSUCC0112]